jgi:hypothetical protein
MPNEAAPPERVALVVATNYDDATKFIRPAADAAVEMLRAHGHEVLAVVDADAVLTALDRVLDDTKGKNQQVETVFVCAHGREGEDGVAQKGGRLLFGYMQAQKVGGAVLYLCSCLKTGRFPEAITESRIGVHAIIGYMDELQIYPTGALQRWLQSTAEEYRRDLVQALVAPLRHVLESNGNLEEAIVHGRIAWRDMMDRWIQKGARREVRWLLADNLFRITLWRNGGVVCVPFGS